MLLRKEEKTKLVFDSEYEATKWYENIMLDKNCIDISKIHAKYDDYLEKWLYTFEYEKVTIGLKE